MRKFWVRFPLLDGYFSHFIVVKIVLFVWKDENKQKEAGDGPFFKKNLKLYPVWPEKNRLMSIKVAQKSFH